MIFQVYLNCIRSIALSCRRIPVNITLVILTPYRNLQFTYTGWRLDSGKEHIKRSTRRQQILYLYRLDF